MATATTGLAPAVVMAVRANHAITVGSGRTVTAAPAGMIPARAWHRMRTGSGTKGIRHYD